ncbi:hypothetical protein [Nocardia sp. NPDC058497]|uniref:hypothetical protein n=1 Tax=Nocardia sp. NPDC058497 TaxID=3346529 RepID=UPI00364C369F
MFDAVLAGFANQQFARNLARTTVDGRENTAKAFPAYVNAFPSVGHEHRRQPRLEMWLFSGLRAGQPVHPDTLGYHNVTTTRVAAEVATTWSRSVTTPRFQSPDEWTPSRTRDS